MSTELLMLLRLIEERPPDSQHRIAKMTDILRKFIKADPTGEAVLAYTLVMAEISEK